MRISLCNEVIAGLPFERQCALAAELGYDGLEIAPFTLGEARDRIGAAQRAEIRNAARAAGIAITGLRWLLVKSPGFSITSDDAALRARTIDFMRAVIDLCAEISHIKVTMVKVTIVPPTAITAETLGSILREASQ
jgi:D-psicose/D-tagatose/L-ribulose 3-epimerase